MYRFVAAQKSLRLPLDPFWGIHIRSKGVIQIPIYKISTTATPCISIDLGTQNTTNYPTTNLGSTVFTTVHVTTRSSIFEPVD